MIDKFKKEAMKQGMKLMTNPKVMKAMADPRLMTAIGKGIEFKGQVQSQLDNSIKNVAGALNLATKSDVQNLKHDLQSVESSLSNLEGKIK